MTRFSIVVIKSSYFKKNLKSKHLKMETRVVILLYVILLIKNAMTMVTFAPNNYWKMRTELLLAEERVFLGGNLKLSSQERQANAILMKYKEREIMEGFLDPSKFLPAHNFIKNKKAIERSEVFKMIRKMPKGAVLHCHSTAFVSSDFVFNLTYRENLYVCLQNDTVLKMRFFNRPNQDCDWKLLSELRKNITLAEALNKNIKEQMSMVVEDPDFAYPDTNRAWSKLHQVFQFPKPLITNVQVFKDYIYRGLQELYEDNVMYVELRSSTSSVYDINGKKLSPLETIPIFSEVTKKFVKEHPDFMGLKLIFASSRNTSVESLNNYITLTKQLMTMYPNIVVGFDLVGQEDKGYSLSKFADVLQNMDPSFPFFFHAGETNWYGTGTDENLIDAVLLNTKRIGHGFAVLKHPLILDMIKEREIAIEINPISNQVLGLVKDLRNHPANTLFARGYPIVISNDDPGIWGSEGLSYDFYEFFMGMMSASADLRSLKQVALNSLVYSGMNKEEKDRAVAIFHNKWDEFIHNSIYNHKST